MPSTLLLPAAERTLNSLISWTFGDVSRPLPDNTFLQRALLTPLNMHVDQVNAELTARFPGAPHTYESVDTPGDDMGASLQGEDILHSLHPTGLPPHELTLKPGMPTMVLRNPQRAGPGQRHAPAGAHASAGQEQSRDPLTKRDTDKILAQSASKDKLQ